MTSSGTKFIFLWLPICGGWEGAQAKCSVSTGEDNEYRLLAEGTEIANKALRTRAWYVRGGADLESWMEGTARRAGKIGWAVMGFGHQARWVWGGSSWQRAADMCPKWSRCVPQGAPLEGG